MDASKSTDGSGDEGNYEDFFSAELFLNLDYVKCDFDFGVVKQQLLCSTAASTDHDLTGQVVWPVSVFLAWFLVSRRGELAGKTVVELGSGAGLSGLVASKFAARTALTDGNEVVLKLLEDNADHSAPESCIALPLLWGEQASADAFEKSFPHPVDVLVGADVVCWPMLVKPILQTIKHLMLRAPTPLETVFYCGFVCRAQSTEDLLFREAQAAGFRFERIPDTSFLPSPRPANVESRQELQLLVFRLDPEAANWNEPVQFSDAELSDKQTAC